MELFSEIYNCYFQVIKSLIEKKNYISEEELNYRIKNSGFEESILYLLPKLTENGWGFYEKQEGFLYSKLSTDFYVPLTNLQKSYLKAILLDDKITLFLSDMEIENINTAFADVEPLYQPDDFYYYDKFSDGDDYKNPVYRKHFQTIIAAIKKHEYLDILYESRHNHRVHHYYLPCRLEYSIKNDCFRLLAVESHIQRAPKIEILNLSRIQEITPCNKTIKKLPDINHFLQRSYYKESVKVLIKNQRNALERAMLQFANYEKNTRKIDGNTYECLIYYNKKVETELLIEILSFGPMMKVVGNDSFLKLVKERLKRQFMLINNLPSKEFDTKDFESVD
ncbi:MAG: WYL domain-containing protein [Lachnospiraceae bacterium]|nr:WYL domain-containing protein [Lachnospiraceae bacterium]